MPNRVKQRKNGQHNLRKGRRSLPNQIYHITTVTTGRQRLFTDFVLGRKVVQSLMRLQKSGRAITMAFVIMPDHLHWLFQLPNGANLSTTVGSMKSQSSCSINRLRSGKNPVWRRGFHDRALRRDEDVVQVARYIVANPLRAKIVRNIGDYSLWFSISV
jgi:REP element-mobilizing transposase RayT